VLTPHEVAIDYFRCDVAFLGSAEFRRLYPTFPLPRADGFYHRDSVEAWTDKSFGIVPMSDDAALTAAIHQRALEHGSKATPVRHRKT
jgi:hypothetical protein